MRGQKVHDEITVKGLLVPMEWDERGQVVGFALSTYDEKEYVLSNPKGVRRLKELLRQVVWVKGTLTKGADGSRVITVHNCNLSKEEGAKKDGEIR